MALSSFRFFVLSIALLISIANANVDDTCKAAAASSYSINYNFCATSLRTNPKSETSNAHDLAVIAAQLCLNNATGTKAKIDDMIAKGSQTPKVMDILKLCSNGVCRNQITLLNGAIDSLKYGKLTDAKSKIDTIKERAYDCGDLFFEGGEKDLVAKDESDLEGLSKLAIFLVGRLI